MYISSECTQLLSPDDEFCTRSQDDSNENRAKLTRRSEKRTQTQNMGKSTIQTNSAKQMHQIPPFFSPSKAFNSTAEAAAMAHLFAPE